MHQCAPSSRPSVFIAMPFSRETIATRPGSSGIKSTSKKRSQSRKMGRVNSASGDLADKDSIPQKDINRYKRILIKAGITVSVMTSISAVISIIIYKKYSDKIVNGIYNYLERLMDDLYKSGEWSN